MKVTNTYNATIYCGFKKDGIPTGDGMYEPIAREAENILQEFCNNVGFCVTVKPTKFIYTGNNEEGIEVGIINYPRFPLSNSIIRSHAVEIATRLMHEFNQDRVSIVCSDQTIMLENKNK